MLFVKQERRLEEDSSWTRQVSNVFHTGFIIVEMSTLLNDAVPYNSYGYWLHAHNRFYPGCIHTCRSGNVIDL